MVGVLIRMKLALMRNAMTGSRAATVVTGAMVGVLLAGGTIALSLASPAQQAVVPDLLAAVYLTWMLGWIAGPIWVGAGVLRAEHFAMLGLPRRQLVIGLLAASFVGITTAVTALAFLSLPAYAARLGLAELVVAIPAVVLQLTCVVLLSRLAAVFFGKIARARTGAAINGVLLAVLMVLSQSGWMLLIGLVASGVLTDGLPGGVSELLRLMPSGWGLAAVEAASAGSWLTVLAFMAAMVTLIVVLLALWARTLGEPQGTHAVVRGPGARAPRRGLGSRPGPTILSKEVRTWWRDPARTSAISAPLAWGLGTALLPLTFGEVLLLPWAGLLVGSMAATFLANQYGFDGTALWLTVQTGTEREDIRGRQWAYVLVYGPIALTVTVALTFFSGLHWAWPWALGLLPAMIGGGAGLVAWTSVTMLTPGPDPHQRADNPLDTSDDIGTGFLMFMMVLIPPLVPAAVLIAAHQSDDEVLGWSALPLSIATGVLVAWWLGRAAYRTLQDRGPELLFLMRTGKPESSAGQDQEAGVELSGPAAVMNILGWVVAGLATFPQGLVPIVLKLLGEDETRVWFLAMYLPEPFGWLTALGMVGLGLLVGRATLRQLRPAPQTSSSAELTDQTRATPRL